MSRFSDKLNFVVLQEGLKQLGLKSSDWCTSKEEAVNAIYLYFKTNEMELDYICPNCGGSLPEVEACPFCGESFSGKESNKSKRKYQFIKNNVPVETQKYGGVLVQRFNEPVIISSMDSFGTEAWQTIKDRLMIPEVLIGKDPKRELYSIKDPFSEQRPFKFVRKLFAVEAHKKSLVIYLTFLADCYKDYCSDIVNLPVPFQGVVAKYKITNEKEILKGINIILQTFKISKTNHERENE